MTKAAVKKELLVLEMGKLEEDMRNHDQHLVELRDQVEETGSRSRWLPWPHVAGSGCASRWQLQLTGCLPCTLPLPQQSATNWFAWGRTYNCWLEMSWWH